MSDIKMNRAAEIQKMYAEDERAETAISSAASMAPAPKKSKAGKVILTLFLIAVVVLALLYVVSLKTNWNVLDLSKASIAPGTEPIKASDWQAVFLTNGQVYFGKLDGTTDAYPTLEDIYYLQVQQAPIQPAQAAGGEEAVQSAETAKQQLILVKFGTELHRPMDKMYINKDHIMFFEDLSSASNVVTSIEDYKKQQEKK
ncbi:hypothetical protein COU23_03265 [Candidatus Kuenenbacteria bacterium CG10_big_fil_rev_8_21_14_0_10_36_11]|uniref:Uncharacterized protein n=1 Tax=Candidatus Kuenenbacteria bacterium CG10_big_fil_rev_8_21_14_0_10_36_11 TaxID=1974618 RepID=A0A2M6W9R3_9BACT|nr:MAG: hypothetical protein COU23_03265 [Candidatus Kuenenbacteria bacterium CG10_big_fil_rev_8_21_14_0_10_36_11]